MEIDTLWDEVVQIAGSKKRVSTLKGKAAANIISVEENGRVRQKFVKKPLVERYVLGLMKLVPAFEDIY
ncbi:hypothetical protein [Bacillus sp. AK031]